MTKNVMTLAERLQWVIDQKIVKSARAWSMAAHRTPSHVQVLLTRGRNNPKTSISVNLAKDLAEAAGISFEWLARGIGEEPRLVVAQRLAASDRRSAHPPAPFDPLAPMLSSPEDVPAQTNLEVAIAFYPGRWPEKFLQAAREIPFPKEWEPWRVAQALDRLLEAGRSVPPP